MNNTPLLYNDQDETIVVDLSDDIKPLMKSGNVKQYNRKRSVQQQQQTHDLLSPLKPSTERYSLFNSPDDNEIIIDLDTIDSSYSSNDNQQQEHHLQHNKSSTTRIDFLRKIYDYPLSEYAVEEMDKKNPGMTARERVLNWRIDKTWPTIDNSLDDVQSYSSIDNCKDLQNMDTPTATSTNNSNVPTLNLVNQLKKFQEDNPIPSSIKIRRNYDVKLQNDVKTNFKMPDAPVIIATTATNTTRTTTDDENSANDDHQIETKLIDTKDNENGIEKCESPLTSPKSNKEEFYKYLGIDTTPSHDKKLSNSNRLQQKSSSLSAGKRRSLRVKVQQIAMNNIAKFNKEQEDKNAEMEKIEENRREFVKRRLIDDSQRKRVKKQCLMDKQNILQPSPPKATEIAEIISIQSGKSIESKSHKSSLQQSDKCSDKSSNFLKCNNCPTQSIENKMEHESSSHKSLQNPTTKVNGHSDKCSDKSCNYLKDHKTTENNIEHESNSQMSLPKPTTKLSETSDKCSQNSSNYLKDNQIYRLMTQPLNDKNLEVESKNSKPTTQTYGRPSSYKCSDNYTKENQSNCLMTQSLNNNQIGHKPTKPTLIKPATTKPSMLERRDYNKVPKQQIPSKQNANNSYKVKILVDNDNTDQLSNKKYCQNDTKSQNSEKIPIHHCHPVVILKSAADITNSSTTESLEIIPPSNAIDTTIPSTSGLSPTLSDKQKALKQLISISQCETRQKLNLLQRKQLKQTISQTKESLRRCSRRSQKLVRSSKKLQLSRKLRKTTAIFAKRKTSMRMIAKNGSGSGGIRTRTRLPVTATIVNCSETIVSEQKSPPNTNLDSGLESDALKLSDIDQSDVAVDRTTITTPDNSPSTIPLTDDSADIAESIITAKNSTKLINEKDDVVDVINGNSDKKQFNMLAMLYTNNAIITVSELLISFWMCPNRIYTTFSNDRIPKWKLIGSIDRVNKDIELQTPYQNRICTSKSATVAYYELRVTEFKPNETRECYLSSVYANIYLLDSNNKCILQTVDLDRFSCEAKTIHYVVLPNDGKLVMAWTEQRQNRRRCGLCRYSLIEFDILCDIYEFPLLHHSIHSLKCLDDEKLFGFGDSTITMWNHMTGDLLLNIDLEYNIGRNLDCILWNESNENCLLLAQYCDSDAECDYPTLKIIALNLTKSFRYTVVAEHKMPTKCKRITTTSMTSDELVIIFENNQSVLLSLLNTNSITVKFPKQSSILCNNGNIVAEQKTFVQNGRIYQIDENMKIDAKTIFEYFANLCDINKN